MTTLGVAVTAACNFRPPCSYCYASPVGGSPVPRDLDAHSFEEHLIPAVEAERPFCVDLEGGEPFLRYDRLIKLVTALLSSDRPRVVTVSTNGYLATEERIRELAAVPGAREKLAITVALDSPDPKSYHDTRGGPPDAGEAALRALKTARKAGLETMINCTVSRANAASFGKMAKYASRKGHTLCVSYLMPAGLGAECTSLTLSPAEMAEVDRERMGYYGFPVLCIDNTPLPIDPAVWELHKTDPCAVVGIGCPSCREYVRIAANGDVQPCGLNATRLGNVTEQSVSECISSSEFASAVVRREITGKCGTCRYLEPCGGCRARALHESGSALGGVESCPFGGPDPHPVEGEMTERFLRLVGSLHEMFG